MFAPLIQRLRALGPGLILAAAGIGASDVVVASVTGMRHGFVLLWAILLTAGLKYVLTESLARWQLATGETIVRAWVTRFPRWVAGYFAGYLLLWTFLVGAALSSACGLAAASLFPGLSVPGWGALHAILAAVLVALNRYERFQWIMKCLIAVMALSVLACAALTRPDPGALLAGLLLPRVPAGGGAALLALLGGIGGSLTVVCYAYWLRESGWQGPGRLAAVRADVRLAYAFTAVFAVALVVIGASASGPVTGGTGIAIEVATRLQAAVGPAARWIFLTGFWCTVFTSMLGVWQGVPSIYVDFVAAWRNRPAHPRHDRLVYLLALGFIAGPPLVFLQFKEPVAVVLVFAVAGAFFMPFLAATLLYLNNRRAWLGDLANRWPANLGLGICLLFFVAVCAREIALVLSRS